MSGASEAHVVKEDSDDKALLDTGDGDDKALLDTGDGDDNVVPDGFALTETRSLYSDSKEPTEPASPKSPSHWDKLKDKNSGLWRKMQRRVNLIAGLRRDALARRSAKTDKDIAKSMDDLRRVHWEDLLQRSKDYTGVLVDFIHRISSQTTTKPNKKRAVNGTVAGVLLEPHQFPLWNGLVFATAKIGQELLFSNLMEEIVNWQKTNRLQSGTSSPNLLKQLSLQIMKCRSEAKCLAFEVDSWLFRHKILHCNPPDSETAKERHDRKQQFWAEFHEGNRRVEESATKPPFKDDLRERMHPSCTRQIKPRQNVTRSETKQKSGIVRPKSAVSLRSPSKQSFGCVSNPHAPRKGDCLMQDFDWKRHASRSRASAGNWDWSHGSPTLRRPSTAPVRRSERHWSNCLLEMTDEEVLHYSGIAEDENERISEGLQETFLTRRANAKLLEGTDPSMRKANMRPFEGRGSSMYNGVKKSASAPNFKKMLSSTGLSRSNSRDPHGKIPEKQTLPAVRSAVFVPWQNSTSEPILKCSDAPAKQYLRACAQEHNIPRSLPFLSGHSTKFKAGGQVLSDDDLLGITVTLDEIPLTEVDLDGNTRITEKSLLPFVQALTRPPISDSLRSLSLKRCIQASKASIVKAIIDLVGTKFGAPNLQHLNLSDVHMGLGFQSLFANAVAGHASLKFLEMCNAGLGLADREAQRFIHGVLGSHTVETLDLGWNCFSADVLSYIGERHVEMQKLRKLGLSNCSSSPIAGHATNIVYFLEHLSRDRTLRSLDVSLNHIDFRGALVLEDSLMNCRNLTELNIADNPLGVIGMRSLLRILCRDSSGLLHFDCTGCSSGVSKHEGEGLQVFRASTPGGRYKLELDRPYHRALLRMLYKTCDNFNLDRAEAFLDVRFSLGQWDHAQKDALGIWTVPKRGKLSVTFRIDEAIRKLMHGVTEIDFEQYLRMHYQIMRQRPSFRKVVPLFAQWKSFDGCTADQQVMLDALAKDFLLSFPHMCQLCESDSLVGDVITKLLGCVEGGHLPEFLTLSLSKRELQTFVQTLRQVHCLLCFNAMSPNGHYSLNLANHAEHALAERLLLLDRWESSISQRRGLKDVSQRGNHSAIRNELFHHLPIKVRAMVEWHLPEHDVLEFDYSSRRRLPSNTAPMSDATHSNIMITLQESGCNPKDQTVALRLVSHCMFMTAKQLRAMFSLYKDEELFVELIVIFCLHIVDMQNEKIYRVRVEKPSLALELNMRLGFVQAFPFIQPEQAHFVFDFSEWDQRLAANLLLNLASAEDRINLKNPMYNDNGKIDPFLSGVPRLWDTFEKMPKSGVFSLEYQCAPEHRRFERRKQLFEQYSYRTLQGGESDVFWWSSLADVNPDVLSYVEFLSSQFSDMHKAFETLLHGADVDHSFVSLRDFEDVSLRLGCKKFQGPDEKHRLTMVFRFMDASGEGQVSKDEFMVMDQMFKEILLSISEFVEFCIRTFGNDLSEAWNFLDDDGSGEIEAHEWSQACADLGYCGPVGPIFRYLDKDDEGTVSYDEFAELEKFKKTSDD